MNEFESKLRDVLGLYIHVDNTIKQSVAQNESEIEYMIEETVAPLKKLLLESLPEDEEMEDTPSAFNMYKRLGWNEYRTELKKRLGLE